MWHRFPSDHCKPFNHENPLLNENVLQVIKPIYDNLSADTLLEQWLGSET